MISQDLTFEIKKLIGPLSYSTWKFKIKKILLRGDIWNIVDCLTPIRIIDSHNVW